MRVGVVKQFGGEGYQAGVVAALRRGGRAARGARRRGRRGRLPALRLRAAGLLPDRCRASAPRNLARFDGMRYGLRVGDDGTRSAEEVMALTREAGFGAEVKRRIMLGTYALSSGYYDAYYGQAQKVRTLITRDFDARVRAGRRARLADHADHRVPDRRARSTTRWRCTSPTCAPSRPTSPATPRCRCPCGLAPEDGLPVGLQIIAPPMADDRLYRVGAALEAALRRPLGPPAASTRHRRCDGADRRPALCKNVQDRSSPSSARDGSARISVASGSSRPARTATGSSSSTPLLNAVVHRHRHDHHHPRLRRWATTTSLS